MALPPGFVEEGTEQSTGGALPPGFSPEGALPSPAKPVPPPPGLISSFLLGREGASGGLADIPRGIASTIGSAVSGVAGIPGAISNFVGKPGDPTPSITGLPPALEALIPGGAFSLGAGKSIVDASRDQFKASKEKGRGTLASAASAVPFIGAPAAQVGEDIASGDSSRIAAGAGSATALLAPFGLGRAAVKGAAKLPPVGAVAHAIERVAGNSVVKSYARALEPPTKKLALAAREVAPTLADANISGMSRDGLARHVASKTAQAGRAVDAAIQYHGEAPIKKAEIIRRLEAAKQPHINPLTNSPMTPEGANAVATISEIVQEVNKNLPNNKPPVPPGHTRLYRGQSGMTPDYIKTSKTPQGRWFTPSEAAATDYAGSHKGSTYGSEVVYVDVPNSKLTEFGFGNGDPRAGGEFLVSRELANQAKANVGLREPTVVDLVRYKRALDAMITKGKNAKFSDLATSGKLSYYKDAANILRDTLNDVHPDIASANKNFSQWATAKRVLEEARKVKEAKEITHPGALGGLGTHATLAGAAIKAWQALSLKRSPAWNTLMGAQKNKINSALKTGDFSGVETLLVSSLLRPPPSKPTYFPDLAKSAGSEAGAPPPPIPELGVP